MRNEGSGRYELWLTDANGRQIANLDQVEQFSYVKTLGLPGAWTLTLPDVYPDRYWAPDHLIQFWRHGPGHGGAYLDYLGFLRRWRYWSDLEGTQRVLLSGPDQNCLLDRRIVAYAANSNQAKLSNKEIDDGMKRVVKENLGSSAPSARQIGSGFTVQVDRSVGAAVYKKFAWRIVGQVLRDLAALSQEQGPEILYWVRPESVNMGGAVNLRFETATSYLGHDRSTAGGQSLTFGLEFGNVANSILDYDYTLEANHIYAGGQGEEDTRTIVEASDDKAERLSQWARIERFVDARNTPNDELSYMASQGLADNAPAVNFQADILNTPQAYYGDWNFGDLITVQTRGQSIDALVRSVRVVVVAGDETVTAKVKESIA